MNAEKLKILTLAIVLMFSTSFQLTMASEHSPAKVEITQKASEPPSSELKLASQDLALFVKLPHSGHIPVTLHPNKTVKLNTPTIVAFGIPFPRNTVSELSSIKITDSKQHELPSQIKETLRWRSLKKATPVDAIRSIVVFTEVTFNTHEPLAIKVHYGSQHKRVLSANINLADTWGSMSSSADPLEYDTSENIREPKVYATLPPQWLGACLLRTRSLPIGQPTALSWFDEAFIQFSHTAVNNVSKSVKPENLIQYQQQHEPWLYDRAMTLYGIYIRTGKLKWLRHAHRATQFYARHITRQGYFDKKAGYNNGPPNDLKYSYAQSMLVDLMLTGDTRLVSKVEAVATAAQRWNAKYTYQTKRPKLWTERHQAYALLAALSAWEATGKKQHEHRIKSIIESTFSQTLQPPNQWKPEGCPLHAYKDHEGFGNNAPVCSSWMNALLAEAVYQYYLHSEDKKALQYLSHLGDYIQGSGTYLWKQGGAMQGLRMPHYLSSNTYKRYPDGNWDDHQHACDVAGAAARSAWARKKLGDNSQLIEQTTQELLKSCRYSLNYMHRKNADTQHGKTVWRLSVPRQYSWWFGSTLDLGWLLNTSTE